MIDIRNFIQLKNVKLGEPYHHVLPDGRSVSVTLNGHGVSIETHLHEFTSKMALQERFAKVQGDLMNSAQQTLAKLRSQAPLDALWFAYMPNIDRSFYDTMDQYNWNEWDHGIIFTRRGPVDGWGQIVTQSWNFFVGSGCVAPDYSEITREISS